MKELKFFVAGTPKPQGSKRAFVVKGKPVLTESAGEPLRTWRADLRVEARQAMLHAGWETVTGPIAVLVAFRLPRPKTLPKRVLYAVKRPDLDKLVRAVLDALTSAGVFRDDSQVVQLIAYKRYADEPGARFKIRELP